MEYLTITTICRGGQATFNEITKLAGKHDCHINYGNLHTLGLEDCLTLQLAGNWSGIAKIESALPALGKRLEVDFIFKRSHLERIDRHFLPYQIDIVAVDQPGVAFDITDFLMSLELIIQHLEITTRQHQQTPLLIIKADLDIPADNNIADIREQFLIFCDELNLDGTMEPKK